LQAGNSANVLWESLASTWCQNQRLPREVLAVTRANGGLGIETSVANLHMVPHLPKIDVAESVSVEPTTRWRIRNIVEYGVERYGVTVEDGERIAADQLRQTVLIDSVRQVAASARKMWVNELKDAKRFRIIERDSPPVIAHVPDWVMHIGKDAKIEADISSVEQLSRPWGSIPHVAIARKDHAIYGNVPFRQWLEMWYPDIHSALRFFHRSWHMSEALDYLEGTIAGGKPFLHPQLSGLASKVTASIVRPERKVHHGEMARTFGQISKQLEQSVLSRRVYWW
jgi:hypothetical protein